MATCLWVNFPVDAINISLWAGDATVLTPKQFLARKCMLAEVGFISYFENEELEIRSVDVTTKQERVVARLPPFEKNTRWLEAKPTDVIRVLGKAIDQTFVVNHPGIHILGPTPDNTTLGITIKESDKIGRVFSELKRVRYIKRVFTDVGFKRIKMPRNVLADIQTYWRNNKMNKAREEWINTGFFVNWFEVNQDLVVPPFKLKHKWQLEFMPVIEEWTNTKMEPTDIYGIRTYYDGAWLSNHVDRESTHAASAIINVEQEDVREPWEVHIWDIHGVRHRVEMAPGDALLYESARCMHGRPAPFQGKSYSNIFVHYRPLGNPNWYSDPTVGQLGPDISAIFDPAKAKNHEIGIVGEDAARMFPTSKTPVDEL